MQRLASSILVPTLLAAASIAHAAADQPYKVLDDRPKVIFYLSNSHAGHVELQQHLDHAGFAHIKVHPIKLAYKFQMDPKTGEFKSAGTLDKMQQIAREEYPDHDMITVRQGNSGAPFRYDPADAEAKEAVITRGASLGWIVKSNGEYLAMFRKRLMERGFKEFYFLNHHYSRPGGNDNKGHPLHLETIADLNKRVGYEVGIDCWPTTKPYYPRTVGFDYWHNNHFGRLAKLAPLVEAMARNSGLKYYPKIDLDKALAKFEARTVHFTDITPVGKGQRYAVGDTIDITWKVDDADLYPRVHVFLEVNGGRDKMFIAQDVLSAQEHYRWTIPDTQVRLPDSRGRGAPIVSKQCRIRVSAALGKPYWVTSKAKGFFEIVPARTEETDKPAPGPVPAPIPDNLRKTGDLEYRVARWPGFYRAAIAIAIRDDGSPELFQQLQAMSKREHPDLMTVLVEPKQAEAHAQRWKQLMAMGHEVVPEGALALKPGKTQTTYRALPKALDAVEAYHIEVGGEKAMRELIARVLAERAAAFVTFGRRGDDFEAQIDALHDHHAELWNGPVKHLLRYVAQRRAATLEVVADEKNQPLQLRLSDDLPDAVYRIPLYVQVPCRWPVNGCTQDGKERGFAEVATDRGGGRFVRFEAVPDAGPIGIARK